MALGTSAPASTVIASASSQYYSRTYGAPTNQFIWTWEGWVQFNATGSRQVIFAGGGAGPVWQFEHQADNTLALFNGNGGSTVSFATTTTIADTGWHHVCLAVNTTTITTSVRIFIDNVEASYNVGNVAPVQNTSQINAAVEHDIGRRNFSTPLSFDGNMSNVRFVDGQQLTSASFVAGTGANCVDAGYTGTLGNNGSFLSFVNGAALGNDDGTGLPGSHAGSNNWTPQNSPTQSKTNYPLITQLWQVSAQEIQPPARQRTTSTRFASMAKGEDVLASLVPPPSAFSWFFGTGADLSTRRKVGAEFARGDDGTEAPFVYVPPVTFAFLQSDPLFQPPALRVAQRIGGLLPGDAGDQNDQPPIIVPFPEGWAVQPPQPPARQSAPNVRAAATMRGDDGTQATEIRFLPAGWAIDPPQPPHPTPEKRAAAIMRGDDGTQAVQIRFFPIGFSIVLHQPQHPTPEKRAGAVMPWEDGTQLPFVGKIFTSGWEVQPPQPPRWPPYRSAAAIMRGDDGTQAQYFAILNRFDFGPEYIQLPKWPRTRSAGAIMRGLDGIEQPYFGIVNRFDFGPQIVARKRFVSLDDGDRGIQAPVPRPFWGWDVSQGTARIAPRRAGAVAGAGLVETVPPLIDLGAWAFDTTELMRRRRPEPAIEIEPSFLPLPRAVPWGHEAPQALRGRRTAPRSVQFPETFPALAPRVLWWGQEPGSPLARRPRRAPLDRGFELVTSFPAVWTAGWEVAQPQPPRPRQNRAGAMARGIDGADAPRIVPVFDGWNPVLFWPPHPRPERAGATMLGDIGGAWGPFVYLVPSGAIATDFPYWSAVPFDIGLPP